MDPRQRGLFAAAWNVGLVAAAARGGLDAMSLGAIIGPQGAIYRKASYPQPGYDDSGAAVYFRFITCLRDWRRPAALGTSKPHPVALCGIATLAYETKAGPVLWLANLTGDQADGKDGGIATERCRFMR